MFRNKYKISSETKDALHSVKFKEVLPLPLLQYFHFLGNILKRHCRGLEVNFYRCITLNEIKVIKLV